MQRHLWLILVHTTCSSSHNVVQLVQGATAERECAIRAAGARRNEHCDGMWMWPSLRASDPASNIRLREAGHGNLALSHALNAASAIASFSLTDACCLERRAEQRPRRNVYSFGRGSGGKYVRSFYESSILGILMKKARKCCTNV